MSTIFYREPELVIALNKRIIFVNPNDLQIFKEIILPEDLLKCGLKVNNDQSEQDQAKEQPTIQDVKMSSSKQLLAVTTIGQKSLLIYQLRPEHAKLVSVRSLARASSALAFSQDSKKCIVTDKSGDCYEYDCENLQAEPKLLLGHLSIVYDIQWSQDEKFIITCDRDDKIRVTNYPECYDVHGYCLGHKEFVSGIELLNSDVLLSVSGDKTLRLWNYKEGKELACAELPAPGIKFTVQALDENKYQLAVLLHQPNECVSLYEIASSTDTNSSWNFKQIELLSFPEMICCNLCFAHERLYVVGIINEHFTIKAIAQGKNAPDNWLKMIEEQFKEFTWCPEDISAWFKKRYDNVSEYLERKRRRIEKEK